MDGYDWNAYVDEYCERLEPGLLGEPLNTVSNLGFLLAAIAIWRLARGTRAAARSRSVSG
ncbi:hypothetical protein [Saccharomonospora sp. CUA-673]|uniref:hypothetical protein n=1 Tax=Saccharomonospora sp. CUA-673 TaxID=1904969 RepID=UPI002100DB85|nr:hypothetical protein [Saccharomonospora sp. CUA-673]